MTTAAPAGPGWTSIAAVIATAAVIGVGNALLTPLISIRVEAAGISTGWNGLLAAMPAIAILASGAYFPGLIKRCGPLFTFYACTALAITAILIFPLTDNFAVWVVLKLAMGATLGLQWVVSEAWINSLAAGPRRGAILGIYVSVFSAGLAMGPVLLSFIGTSGHAAFVFCAAIYAICGLPLPLAQKMETLPEHQQPLSIAQVLRIAPAENIGSFINGATWGSILALFPLYAMHLGEESGQALRFLSAMCIGSLICQPVIGRLIDRFTPRVVLLWVGVVQVLSCVVLASAIATGPLVWLLLLLWGAAIGAMYTASLTGLGMRFPQSDLAAASTAFTMVWEAGALSGPMIIGVAMGGWDPHGMAVVIGVFGVALVLASRRAPRAAAVQ